MKPGNRRIEIEPGATDAYHAFNTERQRSLAGPEDDMWASFADMAEPHAVTVDGETVGRFSVDGEHQLHAFYISDDFEAIAADLFTHVVNHMTLAATMVSTVDPKFLSLSLAAGGVAEPVAFMYDHIAESESNDSVDVRLAAHADHAAAVGFDQTGTGSPEAFLNPFLAERIDRNELYLVETDGRIVATGECRVDSRADGYAHLGLVVDPELRGQGIGSRLMHTLVKICRANDLTPLCSTEPTNLAAQNVIRHAGFRNRHQVFKVALTTP